MENKLNETLIDLSVDIYQKCPTLPNHPPMVLSDYQTHKTIREAEGVKFSCASMYMSMGEHTGTHVDAFNHFDPDPNAQSIDQMPLENFYTDGICLDLSNKPLKSNISVEDLENALSRDNLEIRPKDTVLLYMAHYERTYGTKKFLTDFPGLTKESAVWLGKKGITSFGVEAVSPGTPGKNNFEVHKVCRDMGFTHIEGLANLDKLIRKGRFKFIGLPLRIRGGTGSPIRAIAVFNNY